MTINDLKSLFSRFHIRPSKSMGQNFLLSETALDDIVNAAELKSSDTVLEIGPGLGVLTRRLAERAGLVLAVEKDYKLTAALRRIFRNKKNVKIIRGDVLFFDPRAVIPDQIGDPVLDSRLRGNDRRFDYKLVANIPYYITGKLLQNFLSSETKPSLMVLLLQKEVAERIIAKPGEMSILSVSVQFYADPEIISIVPRTDFYPAPEVDSAVIRLKVLSKPRFDVDEKQFFRLVKIGFSNKRKMLKNNLSPFYSPPRVRELEGVAEQKETMTSPKNLSPAEYGRSLPSSGESSKEASIAPSRGGESIQHLLESIGLNSLCRAQDLSLQNWFDLYTKLCYN